MSRSICLLISVYICIIYNVYIYIYIIHVNGGPHHPQIWVCSMLVCNGPVGIDSSKHWFSARGEKRIESFKVTKTQLQRSSNPLDLTFCLHRVFGSFQQPGHVESSGGQVGTAVQDLPTCQHVRFSYHKLAIVAQTYPVHSGHSTLISNH